MRGIYAALLGVFDKSGRVDTQGTYALVRHNILHCRVDGLYVNGSTGENFLMSTAAKRQMLAAVAQAAQGEIHLIAHVGSNVIEEALELADYAEELGYDAVSAVTPFYYKFTVEEIKGYYRTIASHSKLPLIAYYIPTLTGVQLGYEDIIEILRIPNVIGLKFTSNDFYVLERVRTALQDKLIFSGYDQMLLSAAVLGTDGAIGSTYNVIGHWAKKLFEAVQHGDLTQARHLQHHLNWVVQKLLEAGIYPTIKEVAAQYGVPINGCRRPIHSTTDLQREVAGKIYEYICQVDADEGMSQ